jgi:hypothetical protein
VGIPAGPYSCLIGIALSQFSFQIQFQVKVAAVLPQLSVTSVQFTNSYQLAADFPGGSIPLTPIDSTVWRSSCSSPPCMNPSAFVQGKMITANVTLALSFAPSAPLSNVRIEGAISGLGILSGSFPTVPAGTTSITVPVTTSTPLPNGTKIYNPMSISWQYAISDSSNSPCNQVGCLPAGSSSSTVYVTMATPSSSYMSNVVTQPILPLPLTVLGLAVGAGGATTPAAAFQNTWNSFSQGGGPANLGNWQTPQQKFYYYAQGTTGFACATNPLQLLTSTNGDGQCGSFALLLMWALAANGISSSWVQVSSADQQTYMLIKNWNAASQSNPSRPYLWNLALNPSTIVPLPVKGYDMQPPPNASSPTVYGDLVSQTTLPGQNTMPPSEKLFLYHFIVKLANAAYAPAGQPGPYFDPSYGVWYAGNADFESKAVWGYVLQPNPGVSSTWWVRAPGPVTGGGCASPLLTPPQCVNVTPFSP